MIQIPLVISIIVLVNSSCTYCPQIKVSKFNFGFKYSIFVQISLIFPLMPSLYDLMYAWIDSLL